MLLDWSENSQSTFVIYGALAWQIYMCLRNEPEKLSYCNLQLLMFLRIEAPEIYVAESGKVYVS